MGRRGTKSKTSSKKKKTQSPRTNPSSTSPSISPKSNPSVSSRLKSDDLRKTLRIPLKHLFSLFTSRISASSPSCSSYSSISPPVLQESNEKIDSILSSLIIELIEDILGQVNKTQDLALFILEANELFCAAGEILNKFCSDDSAKHLFRLSFFTKILKPAWNVNKGLSKSNAVKTLFKEEASFVKNFKDLSVLPLENLILMINDNSSAKVFAKVCFGENNENFEGVEKGEDSEVLEFKKRLDECEKVSNRMKPLVSHEWINQIKMQIGKS